VSGIVVQLSATLRFLRSVSVDLEALTTVFQRRPVFFAGQDKRSLVLSGLFRRKTAYHLINKKKHYLMVRQQ
jgi:hypothetical protein